MKVLSAEQIRGLDAYTIEHEPILSIDLMERAAHACCNWMENKLNAQERIAIVCGPGNNGGDGLAIARILKEKNFAVDVFITDLGVKYSDDFLLNQKRLKAEDIQSIALSNEIPDFSNYTLIIDGIFGSGLNKNIRGLAADLIQKINETKAVVISIDIPSGLFADESIPDKAIAIQADYTLSFEFPKFSFFIAEHEFYLGEIHILPIGLDATYIQSLEPKAYVITENFFRENLKIRTKFSHKGSYGHALLLAGSNDKCGAALLASRACLRAGVGLLTTHCSDSNKTAFNTFVPEAMLSIDKEEMISFLPKLEKYNAIAMGPGIGMEKPTQNVLKLLIQETKVPLLLDADALNILAENKTWLSFLPVNTILTPHPKEFDRLFGKCSNSLDRIKLQMEMTNKYHLIIVLKGANTSISIPGSPLYFNSSGNPGMASAGSGDVLSGIILSLLAQEYSASLAALMGVYLHGKAGDIAAGKLSQEGMIASDIIEYLPLAFR